MSSARTVPLGESSPVAVHDSDSDSDSDFLLALGKRVRKARELQGLSRKSLSRKAEVSERYLAALEAGEGNASVILLRRVAAALAIRLPDLFDVDQKGPRERIRRMLESLSPPRLEEALQRLADEFGRDESVRRRRIALIGLRGAGKSTLGHELAKYLGRRFVELDREIERESGLSLSEVFMLYGQSGYRRIERRCLDRILVSQEEVVLTVGGGIVSEPETYEVLLRNCLTVWVRAEPEEHMARVVAQGDLRPMSGRQEAMGDLRNILSAREPLYAKADVQLNTSRESVEQSFGKLQRLIAHE